MSNQYPPGPYSQPDPYRSGDYNPYQQPTNYPSSHDGYSQPVGGYSQPPGGYSQAPGSYSQPAPYYQAPPIYIQPIYQQPVLMVAQPQTNNKALTSMILGICSWLIGGSILTGIPAIILGHTALAEISRANGTQTGHGMAVAGLILGYASLVGLVLLCFFLLFVVGIFSAAATHP